MLEKNEPHSPSSSHPVPVARTPRQASEIGDVEMADPFGPLSSDDDTGTRVNF